MVCKNVIGLGTIMFFVGLVIASLVAIFIYKSTQKKDDWGPRIAGILNAVQIKILNFLYKYVAKALTD